jgi:hypothetical protein
MKKLLTTLTVATSLIAEGAVAFEANLSWEDANRLLGKPMIQDLSVGVNALISEYTNMCALEGELHLVGYTALNTNPSDYSTYYVITKQPDGEFTLEYRSRENQAKRLPSVPTASCIAHYYPDDTIFYPIKSINGFTDFSSFYIDLMNQGYDQP